MRAHARVRSASNHVAVIPVTPYSTPLISAQSVPFGEVGVGCVTVMVSVAV